MFPGKTKLAAFIARITPMRVLIALASIYLFFIVCYFILASLSNGLNMDTYAADGTLQLYNPMRRLLEGQVIGKDFPFFHGVGVPLLHFPLFYLLGHNVFAADATKWLMSPLLFLGTSFVFFLAFFRKIGQSLIATAVFTILSLVCIDVVWPGNSLLGVRTTFPLLAGAFILWHPQIFIKIKQRSVPLYHVILYILLALAVACGTEQGLAAIIAYLIVETIRNIRSPWSIRQWWWRLAIKALGLAIATYGILSVFTLGHANEALHYALIDIPKDQGWYFGAPPNGFLAWNTLWYIVDTPVRIYMWPIILLGFAACVIARKLKLITTKETYVFILLSVYGVVVFFASIMGYWAPNAQLVPLTRALGVILVAITMRASISYVTNSDKSRPKAQYISTVIFLILAAGLGWYSHLIYKQVTPFPVRQILKQVRLARHAPDGTYVSPSWKQRIQEFAPFIPKDATIWSTYTGVYDSMHGQLNGSTGGEDYIIHALGPERRQQYADDFIKQQPDYAITLRPAYFPYEEWLWIRHWDFYRQLFENYTVIKDNGSHILWKRNKIIMPLDHSTQGDLHKQSDGSYRLTVKPTNTVQVFEATVSYRISKPLPMSDKFSRYLLSINTTSKPTIQHLDISLPSYEQKWVFPIILKPGQSEVILTPHTYGLIYGEGLDVGSIAYRQVDVSAQNTYPFYDDFCSFGGPLPYGFRCNNAQFGLHFYESVPQTQAFSLPETNN